MSKEQFEHEYDLEKLQVIIPKKRDFPMLVTPRWLAYLSQNAHEDFTSDLLLKFLRDDTLFVDVGAHYGYYTLLVGTSHPNCQIIAFEPVPENYEILRRNIELNQIKNVRVHNTALSNKNETRKFNIMEASDCSGFYENPISKVCKVVELEAATLDSLIKEVPKVPVIIKVDTEGHEICVLEGMYRTFRNTADVKLIVEFNPKCLRSAGYEPSDLLKKILQFGFDIYFVDDDKRVVHKLVENNIESWGNYVLERSSTPGIKTYINLLCVKTPEELNKILCNDKLSYAHYGPKDETQGGRFKLLSHLIEGQKTLEIGCGSGDLSVEIARLGFDVVGIDISEPGIKQAVELAEKENLDAKAPFTVMDATNLEFHDNSFDTVLIPEALANVRDSGNLLEEAVRVARNGGRIIVSVPTGLLVPFQGHMRVFSKDNLTTELSQYAEEIQWHELPSQKWLVCSFFVKKPRLDIIEGPPVDILMPTYNGRKYIRNAIKSVINQTYRNWNLVVVNDGGEDIADIINEFKDSRIKYIVAEHKGKSHALNVGIGNSSGELITYLDDDDILYPIHLEVLIKAALEGNNDFVYSDWYEVSLDENNMEVGREFEFRLDVAPWMLIRQNYINHKCILHKRSLLRKAGMYDEELDVLIDWDMIRRLAFVRPPHHVWSVTSERIRYYSNRVIENRISGLWRENPDKARRSVERIINETANLSATAQELKKALVDTMLHRSYHHQLEINSIIQEKASHISNLEAGLQEKVSQIGSLETTLQEKLSQISSLEANLQEKVSQTSNLEANLQEKARRIAGLETSIQEKVSQITNLEAQIQQIQRGIVVQLVNHYQRIVEKLLRPSTRRRYYYELGLRGIRVILNEGWRSFWTKLKFWLRQRRTAPKQQHIPLPKFSPSISKKEAGEMKFSQPSKKPEVSIVIPAYNNWQYTLNCLKSIYENTDGDYEVAVINDASTDETERVLSKVKNLHLVNNKHNVGFVESCNHGARASEGKYILFLNNDTMVTKGWLPPLLEVIKREDVGAVGSKLVYPDKTLQEAGGIIWNDGSGWNYGRGDDPDKPEYNYVREVDYCSGASLLVKRELFEQIGGFDERFRPGYFEDSDLCFSIRNLGYKVMYQPISMIVHLEGVSCGTDTSSGIKKYQEINRPKFVGKWSPVLQKYHYAPLTENAFLARDRLSGKRILAIDHYVPTYDKDAGSFDMFSMLKILVELGNKVTFIGENLLRLEPYTHELQQNGIEVVYAPYVSSVKGYIEKLGRYFDVVMLSRAHIARNFIDTVKKNCTMARVIFDTNDLASLREFRRAEVENDKQVAKQAEELKNIELYLARNSDITFVVSPVEKEILLKEDPSLNVEVIIRSVHNVKNPQKQFSDRRDILFIGGFDHIPNRDAVIYFVKEIFPLVKQRLPDSRFYVVGSNPPKQVLSLHSDAVIVTGYVKDIAPYFENCKVFVAPLRYGAGVKGKILLSMSYGLPVVTTSIGSEGLQLVDGQNVLITDDPGEFAQKVALFYENKELWNRVSRNSLENIKENFSHEAAKQRLGELIGSLDKKSLRNNT